MSEVLSKRKKSAQDSARWCGYVNVCQKPFARAEHPSQGSGFQRYRGGDRGGRSALLESRAGRVWPLMHDRPGSGFLSSFGFGISGFVVFFFVIKPTEMQSLLFLRKMRHRRDPTGGLCWRSPEFASSITRV